jgi:hypothetical protein
MSGPIFDQQPTAINVDVNTPITTTVYDAQATNLNGGNACRQQSHYRH